MKKTNGITMVNWYFPDSCQKNNALLMFMIKMLFANDSLTDYLRFHGSKTHDNKIYIRSKQLWSNQLLALVLVLLLSNCFYSFQSFANCFFQTFIIFIGEYILTDQLRSHAYTSNTSLEPTFKVGSFG